MYSLGDSDTQMDDLQRLKLELEDGDDAVVGVADPGGVQVEDVTHHGVSGRVVDGDEEESDLEIMDPENKSKGPKFGYGQVRYPKARPYHST